MDNIVKFSAHKEIIAVILSTASLLITLNANADVAQKTIEPEMIRIAGNSFIMGCIRPKNCDPNELPAHPVKVSSFEISKTEITFNQWDSCYHDGGCSTYPDDEGWGRDQRPVINISWNDTQQYVTWLSKKTGKHYRLPSEAEWEYVARATTQTFYAHGNCIINEHANFDARFLWNKKQCQSSGTFLNKTLEVGQLDANLWGLHDMHGNVWEWTQDCFHKNYQGAPTHAIPWQPKEKPCSSHVLRGGSWHDLPWDLRSAVRQQENANLSNNTIGFRIAKSN